MIETKQQELTIWKTDQITEKCKQI